MKKWLIPALALQLLLGASVQAGEALKCRPDPNLDPAIRPAEKRGCELRQLASICAKAADKKKLVGPARAAFVEKCEGFRKTPQKRRSR